MPRQHCSERDLDQDGPVCGHSVAVGGGGGRREPGRRAGEYAPAQRPAVLPSYGHHGSAVVREWGQHAGSVSIYLSIHLSITIFILSILSIYHLVTRVDGPLYRCLMIQDYRALLTSEYCLILSNLV